MNWQQTKLPQRITGKFSPPAKLVTALNQIVSSDTAMLPRLSAYAFPWFDAANQQEVMAYLAGMQLASEQCLHHQLGHYKQQILRLVTKDMADRTRSLVASEFGYSGPHYYHPHEQPLPDKAAFWMHEGSQLWTYSRIEDFSSLIPPQALAVRAFLQGSGIFPQAYWVAQQRVDPILSAQFGRWFVALYVWG